jgi:hypothetical protein
MSLYMRRSLLVAALFAIAGCGGGSGQTSLAPTGTSSLPANRLMLPAGVPYFLIVRNGTVRHAIRPTYPTGKSLVFESDFSDHAVNIYQTRALSMQSGTDRDVLRAVRRLSLWHGVG